MPMRRELVISKAKGRNDLCALDDLLLLTAICLAGAVLSLYLSSPYQAFAPLPLLIAQYNGG